MYLCIYRALDHCHQKGVLYLDLKPNNILIVQDGLIKLADFGLSVDIESAKYLDDVRGTPNYMAPEISEQVRCIYIYINVCVCVCVCVYNDITIRTRIKIIQ